MKIAAKILNSKDLLNVNLNPLPFQHTVRKIRTYASANQDATAVLEILG